MFGEVTEKRGWIYVSIERPPDWKLPTFFPLVDAMFKKVKNSYDSQRRRILFDISRLEYMDSTMVSLFLQTARLSIESNKNAIIVAHKNTHDLLCLLGIEKLFDLYSSEQEWDQAQ